MASKQATSRLRRELKAILMDPPPYIHVACDDSNILVWNYLLEGPPETHYDGGWYWGRLRFPREYPFAPPSILMVTPNGRFETNTRLCLSMSDYHPESWQPTWSMSTVLKGLLSFMCEETDTTGAIDAASTSPEERKRLAVASLSWNKGQPDFNKAFPQADAIIESALARRNPAPQPRQESEAAVASQVGFLPSDVVRLRGLKARPELNGREGVVDAQQVSKGRIAVKLGGGAGDEAAQTLALLPINLELLERPVADGKCGGDDDAGAAEDASTAAPPSTAGEGERLCTA